MRPNPQTITGLYVHLPFCRKRCPYCAFNTYDEGFELIPRWVEGILRELELRLATWPCAPVRLSTLYFGGGTPSLLEPDQVETVIAGVRDRTRFDDGAEVTLEVNPGTVDPDRLRAYRDVGVNRVTVGCQSFSDSLLRTLGRDHDSATTRRCLRWIREVGFTNLNVDLMFALPGQDLDQWSADLDAALSFAPEHLSLYNLSIEDGTPFSARHKQGDLILPPESEQAAMLHLAHERCAAAGLPAYEVSNFARPGHHAQHNSLYWTGEPYFGLGPGAHGFVPGDGADDTLGYGRRHWNLRNTKRWLRSLGAGTIPEDGHEILDAAQRRSEALLLGLRMSEGLDVRRFATDHGAPATDTLLAAASSPRLREHLRLGEDHLVVAGSSLAVLDAVITALATEIDRIESKSRMAGS